MLKISKVYKFNESLYYVANKKKKGRRVVYLLRKVNHDGTLGKAYKTFFHRNKFELVTNVKVVIYVKMNRSTRNLLAYNSLVDRTKEILKSNKDKDTGKVLLTNEITNKIAENAYASITYYNKDEGRNYSIKDFARAIGLKNGKKLYVWIEKFLKHHFTNEKYSKAVPNASDMTIISAIKNYQKFWDSIYGFNKSINELIRNDFKAYMEEFKSRGLSL